VKQLLLFYLKRHLVGP